nr:zinc finger CCCH domain-containing protein 18 [Tanacetum cinerariifolium]
MSFPDPSEMCNFSSEILWFVKYSANVRRVVANFSHVPPNEYSPSPNDKKHWSMVCNMASAIICLANNQKFNFSKYILDNLKKNLEAGVPFPRAVTSLFDTMMVQAVKEVGDLPTAVYGTPFPDAPSSSQPQRKHKPKRKERKETGVSPIELHTEDHVPTTSNDPLPSGEDSMQLKELMVLCTNLSNKVLDMENEVIEMKSSHKAKIAELESRVEMLEEENSSLTKELKSFNTKVESSAIQETIMDKEKSSKQGRKIIDIDYDGEVNLENMYNLDMAQARKNMMIYLKNMVGFKMDFFKGINYEEIRPLFEEEYNKVQTLFKESPKMDAERIIAPRKRTRKEKEAEELKRNLEIVPDDVFVNVTPLSFKPLTIMDYKIYKEGNKDYFQIIRENGNHQMYLAFSTMLKNFDREDHEVLWKIVKDRFKESQPKEVLDKEGFLKNNLSFAYKKKESIVALDEALASNLLNQEILEVYAEPVQAIKDAAEGLFALK